MTCIFSVVYNEQTVICVYKFLLKLLRIEKDCGIFKCFCDRKMSWTWNPFGMRPACIWSNIYDTGHWVKVFKASPLSLSLLNIFTNSMLKAYPMLMTFMARVSWSKDFQHSLFDIFSSLQLEALCEKYDFLLWTFAGYNYILASSWLNARTDVLKTTIAKRGTRLA